MMRIAEFRRDWGMRPDPIPPLKAALGDELARVLKTRDIWDVAMAARTHRSELSRIRNGKLDRISLERLIRLLACVRRRVELRVVIEPLHRARTPTDAERRANEPVTEQGMPASAGRRANEPVTEQGMPASAGRRANEPGA